MGSTGCAGIPQPNPDDFRKMLKALDAALRATLNLVVDARVDPMDLRIRGSRRPGRRSHLCFPSNPLHRQSGSLHGWISASGSLALVAVALNADQPSGRMVAYRGCNPGR